MTAVEESKPYTAIQRKIAGGIIGLMMVPGFALGGVTIQALDKLIPDFELTLIRIGSKKSRIPCALAHGNYIVFA